MGYKDSDWLRQKYSEEGLTEDEIADKCDVTQPTIHRWLKKHEIDTRSTGHQQREGPYKDEEWLQQEYIEKRKATRTIAEECDVSRETIRHYLLKYNILIRQGSEAVKTQWEGNSERREKAAENIERIKEENPPEHIVTGKHREETLEKMSQVKRGENNPMWQGGGDRLYYGREWKEIRKEILKRDDHTCQACGHEDESNHVHHIKPVREFDEPEEAHFDSNLVTLCVSCHSEVEPRHLS